MPSKPNLRKSFGFTSASSLVISAMVGSGIFLSPGTVLNDVGNFYFCLLIWVLTGFVALAAALCYLELSLLIPKDGGPYHFLSCGLHEYIAYLYIWMNAFFTRPASLAVGAISFGQYLSDENKVQVQLAIIVVIFWSLLVHFSTEYSKYAINICTFAKFTVLFVIVFFGVYEYIKTGKFKNGVNYTSPRGFSAMTAFSAFWSYEGWDMLAYVTEEIYSPERIVPLVTYLVTPTIIVLYCLVNVSYNVVLSPTQFATSNSLVADFGYAVLGNFGRLAMIIIYSMSVFGMGISTLLSSSRLTMTASVDDENVEAKALLWRPLGYLDLYRNTPVLSIYATSAVAVVLLVIFKEYDQLTAVFGWTAWLFQLLIFTSLIFLRFQKPLYKDKERLYITPIILVIIAILAAISLVILPLLDRSSYQIYGSSILLGLFGVFWYLFKKIVLDRYVLLQIINDKVIVLTQKLFNIA